MKFHYPTKPFFITQPWGYENPMYRENGFNFDLHNGIDFKPRWPDITYPVYFPADGFIVHQIRNVPTGGGKEIWFISKEKHQIFDKECYLYMVFCHAEEILIPVGYEPAVGELFMIGDNTGFSTGPHTHWGLYRIDFDGRNITWLDKNRANGSFSPTLFLSEEFAVDKATTRTLITSGFRYLKYLITGN